MREIRTVLCPVDFSAATPRQVGLAGDLCRLFGAQLVLHHNIAALAPGAGVGWMWAANHPPESEEAVRLRLLDLTRDAVPGLDVKTSITRGPTTSAVQAVCEASDAELVVLNTHGEADGSHASVTEEVLSSGRQSVLVLHEAGIERRAFGFDLSAGHRQVTIVPTDFTPGSRAAVDFAFDLARTLPLELHLLHLVTLGVKGERHAQARDEWEQRLRALIPADSAEYTRVHVREGAAAHGIVKAAEDLGAGCIVMGEHTRQPLRRWLSRDTARAVLRVAPCPVWYVPGRPAA